MPKVTDAYRRARREQILEAARRCFLREGFHRASMSDLQAESGLSAGSLYTYFASKEDVILAIVDENIRDVLATLESDSATASELLARVAAMIRTRQRTDGFASLVLQVWAEATRDERLRDRVGRLLDGYRSRFAELAGTEALGDVLTSLVAGIFVAVAIEGEDAMDGLPDAVDTLLRRAARPDQPFG